VTESNTVRLRRLRFRLKRQGMLELDAWLSGLEEALQLGDYELAQAVEGLLMQEPPELTAIMVGEKRLPEVLSPWLK